MSTIDNTTNYAAGIKQYTTAKGTYTVDLTNKKVDQADIDTLDALAGNDGVRQSDLVAFMQKNHGVVLIDSRGRELDAPEDLLREEPNWNQMKDDIGTIFAEAIRLFAKAAQSTRQTQMQGAETARKSMLEMAHDEKDKQYAAAKSAETGAIVEASVGIAGAAIGAAGGGYGIKKSVKSQGMAGQATSKMKEIDELQLQKTSAKAELDQHQAGTTAKTEVIARRKAELPGVKQRKQSELKNERQELDGLRMEQQRNRAEGLDSHATSNKIAIKKDQITVKKEELKNLEAENKNLDGMQRVAVSRHEKKQAAYERDVASTDEQIKILHTDATNLDKQANHLSETVRLFGPMAQMLQGGLASVGKASAAPENARAEMDKADAGLIGAAKDSQGIVQSQLADGTIHFRDMANEALQAGRSMAQTQQDTLNRIASNMS